MPTPEFSTIYHPYYLPDKNYVKLQLLFWDKINRIVPRSVLNIYGDEKINEIYGIDPSWLPALSPNENDLNYFNIHKVAIQEAFKRIKKAYESNYKSINDFIGVNLEKAPQWIFEELIDLHLSKEEERLDKLNNHISIHPDAGALILSCLGSSMARRRGFDTISNVESNFYVTAANEIAYNSGDRRNESIASSLGCTIIEFTIPEKLPQLSLDDIVKLREDYSGLRQAFHKTVRILTHDYNLQNIIDKKMAKEKLEECAKDYLNEYEKFKTYTGKFVRSIKDWRTQSFGVSLGAIAKGIAGGDPVSMAIGFAGIAISLLGKVYSRNKDVKEQSFQYLQKLNEKLDAKAIIENMTQYIMPVRGLA